VGSWKKNKNKRLKEKAKRESCRRVRRWCGEESVVNLLYTPKACSISVFDNAAQRERKANILNEKLGSCNLDGMAMLIQFWIQKRSQNKQKSQF